MDNNKKLIISLSVAIILVIIIVVVLVNVLGGDSSPKKRSTGYVDREYQKQVEAVEKGKVTGKYDANNANKDFYALGQDGRNEVDKCIDTFMDLLNNRNYENIYSMLNEEYKIARFDSVDQVKDYIEGIRTRLGGTLKAQSFDVDNDTLIIHVGPNKSVIEHSFRIKNYKGLLPEYSEEVKPEVYLRNVTRVGNARIINTNNGLTFESDHSFYTPNEYIVVLQIVNANDKEYKIDFKDTKLVSIMGGRELGSNMTTTRYITVPAKSKVIYEMGFRKFSIVPKHIKLDGTINNNPVELEMVIDVDDE